MQLSEESLFLSSALEYHHLDTSMATKSYWVITGKLLHTEDQNCSPAHTAPVTHTQLHPWPPVCVCVKSLCCIIRICLSCSHLHFPPICPHINSYFYFLTRCLVKLLFSSPCFHPHSSSTTCCQPDIILCLIICLLLRQFPPPERLFNL